MHPVTPWLTERPLRNFSPGDLRPRDACPEWRGQCHVETGADGDFAVFLTISEGWAALATWLLHARYLRHLRTAREIVAVYAPPGTGPAGYAAAIELTMGEGELDLQDQATLKRFCKAIVRWHDTAGVWDEVVLNSGVFVASLYWGIFRAESEEAFASLALAPSAGRPIAEALG